MARASIIGLTTSLGAAASLGCGRTPIPPACLAGFDPDLDTVLTCEPSDYCERPSFRVSIEPVNVLLVLDRSCSMGSVVDGYTKWSRAIDAIVSVVGEPRLRVRWGLTLFPDTVEPVCEQSIFSFDVEEDSRELIAAYLGAAKQGDHPYYPREPCATNIDAAMAQANDESVFAGLRGRNAVILVTDGRQASCAEQGGIGGAVERVQEMADRGVPTFVIGFGDGVDPTQLGMLSQAGGVPAPAGPGYYKATIGDLRSTLGEVLEGIGCRYDLTIDTPDLSEVTVRFDERERVPYDPSRRNGWSYSPAEQALRVHGEACERMLGRELESLSLELACD